MDNGNASRLRLGEHACRALRPLCRLPLLRHSLALQVTAAAGVGVALPIAATIALTPASAGIRVWAGALVAIAALAVFWALLRCLLTPVRELTLMLRSYRMGERLEPPAEVQQDEVGKLTGEALQMLRETNAHLSRRARRDATTGALNRYGLDAELDYLLRRSPQPGCVGLALIEVRELGRWEMALGPEIVEAVRRAMVERIRAVTPANGAVATVGATWFAFAATDPPEILARHMDALWSTVRSPIDCGAQGLQPTCAMGVAHAQGDESSVGLFHAAEAALLSARANSGSARVEATETSAHLHDTAALALALEEAIDGGHIEARFQPRVDARTRVDRSAEALARWRHPERGTISPAAFIPLANSSGRMVELGRHMLERSVAAVAAWQHAGTDHLVSVNIDAEQLAVGTLEHDVMAALDRHGVAPGRLELEITEASLLADLDGAMQQITQLRERGVGFALDDFGTGYSSLGYLGRLPVDRIKIDRSFVAQLATNEGERITRAIIDLAHSLSLSTTAEGVETEEQAQALAQMGCDEFQGFLFSAAVTAEAIAERTIPEVRNQSAPPAVG